MAARLFAGVVAAAALAAVGPAAAGGLPILRSASVADRHVVVTVSVSDLRPVELLVSRRAAVNGDGALLANRVALRETMTLPPTAWGIVRWQSPKALGRGVYFVQVRAFESGGVTDCPRALRNCNEHWSNIRRVVVESSG